MANDTEKLTSLLRTVEFNPEITCPRKLSESCSGCEFDIDDKCDTFARKAAYLIKNGVFAPPCKVGDTVYFICEDDEEFFVSENKVTDVSSKGFFVSCYDPPQDDLGAFELYEIIGKTAFFSKEKAEDVVRKKRESECHKSWLRTCPCSDGNFKTHLKEAKTEDIQSVLQELPEEGNKTKIKVLKAELNKRLKSGKQNGTK